MNTKLTLRLDEKLVRKAKAHAKRTGKSVSNIVADYFALLGKPTKGTASDLTPLVSSLKGVLRNGDVDEKDYRRHLEQKYL